ncbi:MAG TPA: dimethylsulfonioproprionate lyase family protein [Aestuariivirga sp.]
MKQRDAKLQAFYDLTETAILRRADTCKNAGPAAKPVFDTLRKNVGCQGSSAPERLPVCDVLESALHLASAGLAPIPELAAALNDMSPDLQWKRRNSSPPAGTNFHDGHANALVAGPGGLEEREDVWVGISLLAPHVRYPDHRHPPEEVYVSLAGGAWWNANMDWTTPGPGGLIYNEPNVLHAMRTEEQPLLAIWCLRVRKP